MRRWWAPALVAVVVLVYALLGEQLRGCLGLPGDGAAPTKGAGLRMATWNLRNFPEPTQDHSRLRERLQGLGADLLAVQEIHDRVALQALLPGWDLHLSEQGGRGHQRLGIAFDPAALELVEPAREHPELGMGGRVRPGLSAYLRARDGGPDFHVLVVHLKAKPDGYPMRQQQWSLLAAIAGDLLRRDPDLIILGDFNTTGTRGGTPEAELAALAAVLEPLGLRRLAPDAPCSAYWDGSRRDAWHEPSLLDLVWVADLDEGLSSTTGVRPLHHCARHHCQPFRSTPGHPEPDYADLSDHCPVMLDLSPGRDDDP
jgi:endonuclease/exonuclease/phosphatase family metal-dependent hydrolase